MVRHLPSMVRGVIFSTNALVRMFAPISKGSVRASITKILMEIGIVFSSSKEIVRDAVPSILCLVPSTVWIFVVLMYGTNLKNKFY